jgi:hypothetical protein
MLHNIQDCPPRTKPCVRQQYIILSVCGIILFLSMWQQNNIFSVLGCIILSVCGNIILFCQYLGKAHYFVRVLQQHIILSAWSNSILFCQYMATADYLVRKKLNHTSMRQQHTSFVSMWKQHSMIFCQYMAKANYFISSWQQHRVLFSQCIA